jgi:hypothetical protein
MIATHPAEGVHGERVVDNDASGGGDSEDHVIVLLEESTFALVLMEEEGTEFTDEGGLAVGRDHEGGFIQEVLAVQEGAVLGCRFVGFLPLASRK